MKQIGLFEDVERERLYRIDARLEAERERRVSARVSAGLSRSDPGASKPADVLAAIDTATPAGMPHEVEAGLATPLPAEASRPAMEDEGQ